MQSSELSELDYSNFIIDFAPHVERFLSQLFNIEQPDLESVYSEFGIIYRCKKQFVQRIAIKKYSKNEAADFNISAIEEELKNLLQGQISEPNFAKNVIKWEKDGCRTELDLAARYIAYKVYFSKNKSYLTSIPRKLDPANLLDIAITAKDNLEYISAKNLKQRYGFKYTGGEVSLFEAFSEANYCIYCHKQNKDSCSKGLKVADATYKYSQGGVPLIGCPLEQKISEMNYLKSIGFDIGALAVITIDNPMVVATGHRICNDCMKSCIYQTQEPVNIPKIETRILNDVLDLPYGFEIYSLLTRWNPLTLREKLVKPPTNYKVLVVGCGPAGFTLAHYLLNEGHTVIAIDGAKIEPVSNNLIDKSHAIKWVKDLWESLDTRKSYGFGGVAEYGITVRFDKNYLMLARLILERRQNFAIMGGIRLGSNITIEQTFKLGFDHIALCLGAGSPRLLNIPNGLAKGVRCASDFLMNLQLSGAAREDSLSNLMIRMPIAVIGGGLTAIDAACEALAYYPVQALKFLKRYEILVDLLGKEVVEESWSEEDRVIANEFISHALQIRLEKQNAAKENREPWLLNLLNKWGGATIFYRKSLQESPAYRLNHEEIQYALQEGVQICHNLVPIEIKLDKFGHASSLILKNGNNIEEFMAPTVLIAAGTFSNTQLAAEENNYLKVQDGYFTLCTNIYEEKSRSKKFLKERFITYAEGNGSISFFGDLHPSFAGNVVKAMASAKNGYRQISNVMSKTQPKTISSTFISDFKEQISAKVQEINRLAPNIIEIIIYAPLMSLNFQPGQFYKLQNYESAAETINFREILTSLATEGIAVTGAWVKPEKGLISIIILEMGASSKLCKNFKIGQEIILMGPTGKPTEISSNEVILLVGGGLGNAVLFSIGKAFKSVGSKIIYFAGYKTAAERIKLEDIHEAADTVIWCCESELLEYYRDSDSNFKGNVVEAITAYAEGRLNHNFVGLEKVDRIIAVGSHKMMEAIAKSRRTLWRPYLKTAHKAIASINSPMQCMMKGICAQCLQKHLDPDTGKEYFVFSCENQDQNMDQVCFDHLNSRLEQNSLQEKLTSLWVDTILNKQEE